MRKQESSWPCMLVGASCLRGREDGGAQFLLWGPHNSLYALSYTEPVFNQKVKMRPSGILSKHRIYRSELGPRVWCLWTVGKIFAGEQCGKELISWMDEREAHFFVFWELSGMACSQYLFFLSCIGKKRLLYMWFISPIVLRAFQGSHQEMGWWCGPPVTLPFMLC